jgi:hypothetical protein
MRVGMLALAALSILAGAVRAEAAPIAHHKPRASYTARVVAGTLHYRPCVTLRKTHEGRLWYRDMVSDNTDEGHKRTVRAQIHYVRTGCVSMTEDR